MDAKTKGAWLVHHTHKLEQVSGFQEFNNVSAAGKAGILLSALSASDQTSLPHSRVEVLAKASSINTLFELPKLLDLLHDRGLVETSKQGVDVLGVTTSAVVQHAADIYDHLGPSPIENAALAFSELAAQSPLSQEKIQNLPWRHIQADERTVRGSLGAGGAGWLCRFRRPGWRQGLF